MRCKSPLISLIVLSLFWQALGAEYKFLNVIATIPEFQATGVRTYDQYAYVWSDKELRIYTLSNLWQPRLTTAFVSGQPISDIAVLEPRHLIVCSPEISNTVTEIDSLNELGEIFRVETLSCEHIDREGALLYASDSQKGLEIYDIGKGKLPQLLSVFSQKWGILDFQARYPFIHALNTYGYVKIDITDTQNPTSQVVNYEVTRGTKLCLLRNYVLIADGSTLVIMDLSDSGKPVIVKRFPFAYKINAVQAQGNDIFVALEKNGLRILDLSNPRKIYEKNSLAVPGGVFSLAVENDRLILAAGRKGWLIVSYR